MEGEERDSWDSANIITKCKKKFRKSYELFVKRKKIWLLICKINQDSDGQTLFYSYLFEQRGTVIATLDTSLQTFPSFFLKFGIVIVTLNKYLQIFPSFLTVWLDIVTGFHLSRPFLNSAELWSSPWIHPFKPAHPFLTVWTWDRLLFFLTVRNCDRHPGWRQSSSPLLSPSSLS